MCHHVDRLDWEEAIHGPRWQRDGCDGHHERDTGGRMGSWKKTSYSWTHNPQNLWHWPVAMLLVWQVWWQRQCCCSHKLIPLPGPPGRKYSRCLSCGMHPHGWVLAQSCELPWWQPLHSPAWAAITKWHILGSLNYRSILSLPWRLEVQDQGVGKVGALWTVSLSCQWPLLVLPSLPVPIFASSRGHASACVCVLISSSY